jgi:hypothetical protein
MAGESIVVNVDAAYPIEIEIMCFVNQPPPTRFIPCPQSGIHTLTYRENFYFKTNQQTFQSQGEVSFKITDSDRDTRVYKIMVKIKMFNPPLLG